MSNELNFKTTMKKIRLMATAIILCGASVFMTSCGGNNTETTPDESSIQSEDMYEEGDEPLQGTGADTDTTNDDNTNNQ